MNSAGISVVYVQGEEERRKPKHYSIACPDHICIDCKDYHGNLAVTRNHTIVSSSKIPVSASKGPSQDIIRSTSGVLLQ